MIQAFGGRQQSAFSRWLRTGRLPQVKRPDVVEFKFNPWHDPADGRFTFAGSGNYHSAGGVGAVGREVGTSSSGNVRKLRAGTDQRSLMSRAGQPARAIAGLERRKEVGARPRSSAASRSEVQQNPAAEFVGGVGEGLSGVARGAVAGAHSLLTTNPVTTVRNVGLGAAGVIETVIAAEDTPARIQVSRAVGAIAGASAREIGHATGSVIGNAALVVAPGAALAKVAEVRRLRAAVLRPTYDPPQIDWVKENLGKDTPAKRYNDAATGARDGQAPTLMRTMPNGSKRPVKFDGVQGEYVIDRKWKVVDAPHARAQLLRQSEVLAEHRLIGTWEVPNEKQRIAARRLLAKLNVTNVKIRVVKP